jgi:uracil-DNA glycosylase
MSDKQVQMEESWSKVLQDEFQKEYFKEIQEFLRKDKMENEVFPPEPEIFAAFNHVPFNDVKVVIIGQDPYHGVNQANGLCFSVNPGIAHPPSLINIFKELESDLDIPYPKSGDLSKWAKQGVLLLNATLTVRKSEANSHEKIGWQTFTDEVIEKLSKEREGIVFLLWGGFAKKKGKKIDRTKHHVLETGHPSPLSANRGYWFGNKHFSTANELLKDKRLAPINWEVE